MAEETKEPLNKELDPKLIKRVNDIFEMDPEELAQRPKDIHEVVKYLRMTRENIAAAEAAGKKPTAKAARTVADKEAPQYVENLLDSLAK